MNKVEQTVNYHVFQGINKAKQGDFAGAISEFSQAIEIAPTFAPLYYNRGRAYEDQGNQRGHPKSGYRREDAAAEPAALPGSWGGLREAGGDGGGSRSQL